MTNKKMNSEEIIKILKENRSVLIKYGVIKIGLFGSFIRNEQKDNSDIDFLVEFKKPNFDDFMDLSFFLEELFGRKVELITNGSLSPYIQPYIKKEVKWYETELALS